jgi:hypothetical protein
MLTNWHIWIFFGSPIQNDNSLTQSSPSNTYVTATVFSLAHPYGTPTILSSYSFSFIDDGAPNDGAGTCSSTGGSGGWLCQHRWVAFSGMVGWRNSVETASDSELNNWASPQSQQIAFGRGTAGFVAINNSDEDWIETFKTEMEDGTYCDVISAGDCSGTTWVLSKWLVEISWHLFSLFDRVAVSGGSFTATVVARSAIAIHTGATA